MILPDRLRKVAVVAVNAYRGLLPLPVGHMNLTFYWYGVDQGTFGYNSTGTDIAGKKHAQSFPSPNMHGGVFVEGNTNAIVHYVVVSDKNYHAMYAFAMSQAKKTAGRNNIRYILGGHNCADFVYQAFQVTDLTPAQKDVDQYLPRNRPLAAEYAHERSDHYMEQNISDPEKRLDFEVMREKQTMAKIGK